MLVQKSKSSNCCAQFAKAFKPEVCQIPDILAYALTNDKTHVIDNVIDLYGFTQSDYDAVSVKFEIYILRTESPRRTLEN